MRWFSDSARRGLSVGCWLAMLHGIVVCEAVLEHQHWYCVVAIIHAVYTYQNMYTFMCICSSPEVYISTYINK